MNRLLVPGLVACCLVSGCARYVVRESNAGVVAIPSPSNSWPFHFKDKAHALMTEHFPEGYVVEREEEAVVGETTDIHKTGVFSKRATSRDQTEWRIHYRRRDASEFTGTAATTAPKNGEVRPAGFDRVPSDGH